MDSTAFAASATANSVSVRTNHSASELMKDLVRGFIPRKAKLPLELKGALTRGLGSDQVSGPEPSREGRVSVIHNRLSGQADVYTAEAATEDTKSVLEPEGLTRGTTLGTAEDLGPTKPFQVGCTGSVVGEDFLEVWKGSWESSWVDGHWNFLLSQ